MFGFESGRHGRLEENLDVVVGKALCGMACCIGSGIVVLKYNAIQRLMPKLKQQQQQKTHKSCGLSSNSNGKYDEKDYDDDDEITIH